MYLPAKDDITWRIKKKKEPGGSNISKLLRENFGRENQGERNKSLANCLLCSSEKEIISQDLLPDFF